MRAPNCAEKVTPAQLRVLLALVDVWMRDGRATVRSVAAQTGLGAATTHRHLRCLRRDGLVAFEDRRYGTLRPLVARWALKDAEETQ